MIKENPIDHPPTSPIPESAQAFLEKQFGFRLPNVPLFYEKKGLAPWQAALLWSYEETGSPPFPVIQVRKQGIPHEISIITHELVHAFRFSFRSSLFEEILAYRTDTRSLYRFFGPIFMFRQEPLCFLFLCPIGCIFSVFTESLPFSLLSFWGLGFLMFRLFLMQGIFSLAERILRKKGYPFPLHILVRLTDKQIFSLVFGKRLPSI